MALEMRKQYGNDFDEVLAEKGLIAYGDAIAAAVINHFEANADLKLSGVQSGASNVTVNGPNAIT
jgi:hypothetical protein